MDVAEVAAQANAKTLVLTHFIPMLDRPGVFEQLINEIRSVYKGNVVIGRDLMEIPLHINYPHRID